MTTLDKLSGIEQKAYFLFEEEDKRVVKLDDVSRALGISRRYASKVLHGLTKKNAFEKVRAGLYVRLPASIVINKGLYREDPVLIAAALREKYFLSYYTALRFHGLSQRITTVSYVSNLERSEKIKYHENTIQLVKLIPRRFFGVIRSSYSGKEVFVSDLERTLLDTICRPEYSGGWPEVIQCLRNAKDIDWEKLLEHLFTFSAKSLFQKSGYVFEALRDEVKTPKRFLNRLRKEVSSNTYYFKKGCGRLDSAWNVIADEIMFEG